MGQWIAVHEGVLREDVPRGGDPGWQWTKDGRRAHKLGAGEAEEVDKVEEALAVLGTLVSLEAGSTQVARRQRQAPDIDT